MYIYINLYCDRSQINEFAINERKIPTNEITCYHNRTNIVMYVAHDFGILRIDVTFKRTQRVYQIHNTCLSFFFL